MRSVSEGLLSAAFVLLVTGGGLLAAEPPGEGEAGEYVPSIEEMIAAIQAARGGTAPAPAPAGIGAATGAARPAPTSPESPAVASRRKPVPPPEPPKDVKAAVKAVMAYGTARARYYQMQRKFWHIADLNMKFGSYKQAAQILQEVLRRKLFNYTKSPVNGARYLVRWMWSSYSTDGYLNRYGFAEMEAARCFAYLGDQKTAMHYLVQASGKLGGSEASAPRRALQRTRAFVTAHPAAIETLDRLTASLGKGGDETPSAETQLAIAKLCDPHANQAAKPLRWIESLLTMLAKHPEHEAVASGVVSWMLFRAYRTFEMHEKCVEVLDGMMAKHPGLRLTVGEGERRERVDEPDVLWEKAESYVRLGLMREELKDPRAVLSYRKALECFELFMQKYPKDPRCKPTESYPPLVQRRMGVVYEAVARSSR